MFASSPRTGSLRKATRPELEVLNIVNSVGGSVSLADVIALPRLRSLSARPGTLSDPLEIGRSTGLAFLKLGLEEWRVLLDAGAVPRTLSFAGFSLRDYGIGCDENPLATMAVANELLALWGQPLIATTIVEGSFE